VPFAPDPLHLQRRCGQVHQQTHAAVCCLQIRAPRRV